MSQAHRSTVCCSRFKPLCIIKMPLATHSSCKLFLVSHLLSNISFWQCAVGSPQKSPNKVFSCRNTFFFSPPSRFPLPLLRPLIFLNQHALLKQRQTRSCKQGNKLRKFISQGVVFAKLNINFSFFFFFFLFFFFFPAPRMRHGCLSVVCSCFIRLG